MECYQWMGMMDGRREKEFHTLPRIHIKSINLNIYFRQDFLIIFFLNYFVNELVQLKYFMMKPESDLKL